MKIRLRIITSILLALVSLVTFGCGADNTKDNSYIPRTETGKVPPGVKTFDMPEIAVSTLLNKDRSLTNQYKIVSYQPIGKQGVVKIKYADRDYQRPSDIPVAYYLLTQVTREDSEPVYYAERIDVISYYDTDTRDAKGLREFYADMDHNHPSTFAEDARTYKQLFIAGRELFADNAYTGFAVARAAEYNNISLKQWGEYQHTLKDIQNKMKAYASLYYKAPEYLTKSLEKPESVLDIDIQHNVTVNGVHYNTYVSLRSFDPKTGIYKFLK